MTVELQKRGESLADCPFALDMLLDSVDLYEQQEGSPFYECTLDGHYIAPQADIVTDPEFESGMKTS